MPTVHVNDVDMYYEIHGEGYPLVIILSTGMNVASFNNPVYLSGCLPNTTGPSRSTLGE